MARKRPFIQCDVFSTQATKGNGLAVVADAEGLSESQLQDFAAWTNLAETTFIYPPTEPLADYKLRIFSPTREMIFAGHPTLGSCASWLQLGGVAKQAGVIRQECGIGIVEIDTRGDILAFEAPPTKITSMDEQQRHAITSALEISAKRILHTTQLDNGPIWQVLELASAEDVLACDSSKVKWPAFKTIGLIGAHPPGSECEYEVRLLAPSSGMSEDPITGSLNAALAHWLYAAGRLRPTTLIAQGATINRLGRVSIHLQQGENTDKIMIGGHVNILIEGSILL